MNRALRNIGGCIVVQLAILSAGAAFGDQAFKLDCSKVNYDSRCIWSSYGEPTLDDPDTRNDEVIRVVGADSLRRYLSVMVEFRHEADGSNWMTFRDPYSTRGSLRVSVTDAVWASLLSQLRVFEIKQSIFQIKHKQDVARRKETNETVVCMDGSDVSVDSSVDGTAVHYEADSCENESVYDFIDSTRTLAYSQIPYCAEKRLQWPELCLSLDGDKFSAAGVLARFLAIEPGDCEKSAPSRSVIPLLAEDVEFRAPGLPLAKGNAAVANAWQSLICSMGEGAIIWPMSVEASPEEVKIVGLISGTMTKPSSGSNRSPDYEVLADSTILWKKDATGTFRIADWTVGKEIERKLR